MPDLEEPGKALAPVEQALTGPVLNPFELPLDQFKAGLARQAEKREAFLEHIKSRLKEGTDYGKIHVVSKDRCPSGSSCTIAGHWSKDTLFLSGAENIIGIVSMIPGGSLVPTWPNLQEYEKAAYSGVEIRHILLRCEIRNANGHVLATGAGARSLAQDRGDLNKSLKMCKKSSFVDAVRGLGGLSAMFTVDLEDAPTEEELDRLDEDLNLPPKAPAPAGSPPPPPPPAPARTSTAGFRAASDKQVKAIFSSTYTHLENDPTIRALNIKASSLVDGFLHWFIGMESLKDVDAETANLFLSKFGFGKGREEIIKHVHEYLQSGKK